MLLPETKVYGGRLRDQEQLRMSSSGGAFTALSDVFFSSENAVVCSIYNYNNHQQEYRLITTKDERDKARGSKYIQSIPGNIFRVAERWLKDNPEKELLFVGMGCQAAGFKSYAETKGFRSRTIIVDIICHGSPSPELWKEYLKHIEKKGKINNITFKDKRNGWKAPTAVATVDGVEISLDPYVKIFYNRKGLRPSCHKCPYATIERTTDITIGDFWHIDEKMPEKYDEMGTSLFLVHTKKGLNIFDRAKNSIEWFESNTNDCWQLNLEMPTPMAKDRDLFWQDYYTYGIDHIIKKYGMDSVIDVVKRNVKKIMYRIITGKCKSNN